MILTTPSPLPLYQIFPFSRPKSASSKLTLPVAAQQETSHAYFPLCNLYGAIFTTKAWLTSSVHTTKHPTLHYASLDRLLYNLPITIIIIENIDHDSYYP